MRGWLRRLRPKLRARYGATTVGLDMGSGAIKVMEVAHDGDSPEVIRMGLSQVSADILTSYRNGEPAGMAELLRDLWVREGFGRRTVVIATSQDWVGVEPLHGESSHTSRRAQHGDPEGPGWLPIPLEQAAVDRKPVSSPGHEKTSQVLVAMAERSRVLDQCALLRLAGLEAGIVDIGSVALRNALVWSHPEAAEGFVVAIDLGHKTARVLLLCDGVPVMTRQLSTNPLPADCPFDLMQEDQVALVTELYQLIEMGLESSRASTAGFWSDPDAVVGQIFVVGGGLLIPGMIQTLAEVTGVPARRVQPFDAITLSPTVDSHGLGAEQDILFLKALGLALRRH